MKGTWLVCLLVAVMGTGSIVSEYFIVGSEKFTVQDLKAAERKATQTKFQSQITNGAAAEPGQYPFIALVYVNGVQKCSGSIINEIWVATSANCVWTVAQSDLVEVVAGVIDRTQVSTGQRRTADWWVTPDAVKTDAYKTTYNIALLHLTLAFEWNANVRPVQLPTQGMGAGGKGVTIMGWGSTSTMTPWQYGGFSTFVGRERSAGPDNALLANSDVLRWTNVYTIVSAEAAGRLTTHFNRPGQDYIGSTNFYTGDSTRSTCDTLDDGSPVVTSASHNGQYANSQLLGIAVWRVACGGANNVEFFTDVWLLKEWITKYATYQQPIGIPSYLQVHVMPPVTTATGSWAHVSALFTSTLIGNEIRLKLPNGYYGNYPKESQITAVYGIPNPDVVEWRDGQTLQLRFYSPVSVTTSKRIYFHVTNLRVSGNCLTENWQMSTHACDMEPTPTPIPTYTQTSTPTRTNNSVAHATFPTRTMTVTSTHTVEKRWCTQTQTDTPFEASYKPYLQSKCVAIDSKAIKTRLDCMASCTGVTARWCPDDDYKFKQAVAGFLDSTAAAARTTPIDTNNIIIEDVNLATVTEVGITWRLRDIHREASGLTPGGAIMELFGLASLALQTFFNTYDVCKTATASDPILVSSNAHTIVNEAPRILVSYTNLQTYEDTPLTLSGIQVVDDGPTDKRLKVTIDASGTYGTLALPMTNQQAWIVSSAPNKVIFTGVLETVNFVLQQFTFTPTLNQNTELQASVAQLKITVNEFQAVPAYSESTIRETTINIDIDVIKRNDLVSVALTTTPDPPLEDQVAVLHFTLTDADTAVAPVVDFTVSIPNAAHGTLSNTLPCAGHMMVTSDPANTATSVHLSGTLAVLQAGLTACPINYTPATNYYGNTVVRTVVNDHNNGGTGDTVSTQDFNLLVTPTNDYATVDTGLAVTTDEDTTATLPTLTVSDIDVGTGFNGVTFPATIRVTISTLHGAVSSTNALLTNIGVKQWRIQGTLAAVNAALGALKYTPDADYNGADTVHYIVEDTYSGANTRDVAVTVTAVNDAPAITAPTVVSTNKAANPVAIPVTVADVDAGGNNIVVVLSSDRGILRVTAPAGAAPMATVNPATAHTLTGVSVPITITGTVAQVNNILAGLTYEDNLALQTAVSYIESDLHNIDLIRIRVNDQGYNGASLIVNEVLHITNVTVAATQYTTCQSYLDKTPAFCGCYWKTPSSIGTSDWIKLPTTFPSIQFHHINSPARFVQGCCSELSDEARALKLAGPAGHLGLC